MKDRKNIAIELDKAIDQFFYGLHFYMYVRHKVGDVRVTTFNGRNDFIPVNDWQEKGMKLGPNRLRAFARYFYEAGRAAGKNEVWENNKTIVK